MENDILDSLNDIGYEGPLSDETAFAKALEGGPKSLEFTKLVHILAEEIKKLCNLEETVTMMNDPDESTAFLLELSSFLKELGCPYKKLVTGHMSSRLQSKEDRLLLLDYLVSELMAARMVNVDCPKDKVAGMEIVMQESPTAKDLKDILIALKFNKPPPNITPEILFSKLEAKLSAMKEGEHLVGKPLYNKALSEKEWRQLESSFKEMYEEYKLRRETLITRLECTIQSFEWSDRLRTKKDIIQSTYRPKRENLKVKPDVSLSDFLAARTSLLQVEKTSSATVRKNTQSDVNKVIIGQVPDRGGRPHEQQPPPPEMPSWQQRTPVSIPSSAAEEAVEVAVAEEEGEVVVAEGEEVAGAVRVMDTMEGTVVTMEVAAVGVGADECRADIVKVLVNRPDLKLKEISTQTAITKHMKCHLAVTIKTRVDTRTKAVTTKTKAVTIRTKVVMIRIGVITRVTVEVEAIIKVVMIAWAVLIKVVIIKVAVAAVAVTPKTIKRTRDTNLTRVTKVTKVVVVTRTNMTIGTDEEGEEDMVGEGDVKHVAILNFRFGNSVILFGSVGHK